MSATTAREEKHTHDFGYAGNSYFNGRDGLVRRDDGRTVTINAYDGHMAVNVKDYEFGVRSALDEEEVAKLDDLIEVRGTVSLGWGDGTYEDLIYERVREAWWHDADWLAQDRGFDECFSAGRSGGWCVVHDTRALAEDFPTGQWTEGDEARWQKLEAIYADDSTTADEWDELRPEHDGLTERRHAIERRDDFLALAFDLVDNIAALKRDVATDIIREEHAELEDRREVAIVRGDN